MAYKVMIVDDSRLTRSIIKNALTGAGYEILGEADTGRQAVELYNRLNPDAVTMDMVMPDMDGIQTAKEILAKHPEARILMVTSLGQNLLQQDAIKAGAKGTICKPFQPPQLVQAVNDILR